MTWKKWRQVPQYLNRTRLECKGIFSGYLLSYSALIWIEPDWNVKSVNVEQEMRKMIIWIEPDWNVKPTRLVRYCCRVFIWIEPDWNVKLLYIRLHKLSIIIWIEPDWNVKIKNPIYVHFAQCHLNRTRLECKGRDNAIDL